MLKYIFTFLFISATLFGQITLTFSDQAANTTIGTEFVFHDDTLATSVDIGRPGGGNDWDFSNFTPHFTFTSTSVDKGSTPYAGDYPNANYAFYSQNSFGGTTSESWVYINLQSSKSTVEGIAAVTQSQAGPLTTKITYNPPDLDMVFPATLNTTWDYTGEQTIDSEIGGIPFQTVSTVTRTELIDAYGTMKMPGGVVVEALRIRSDESMDTDPGFGLPISHVRTISYSFMAKTGEGFYVSAEDTNAANSGVIVINGANWQDGDGSSDVERIDPVATDFRLKQNYPNPFNPSTTVEYSIPEGSFVTLRVFNVIGKEVATLVNEFQPAGTYRSDFNAVNLPSGTYFVTLRSGNFSETKKMSLIK
ncbi:MAG: T9SS type A sorting domain-containing protein [Chlorobi bacterium]|nr:T9SS type A sorting domain-containing protein [Chlorobiota bacterium]